MTLSYCQAFLPELVLLLGSLVIFVICLGDSRGTAARRATLWTALATLAASVAMLSQEATLFYGAYRVDAFSQLVKVVLSAGFALVILADGSLADIRKEIKPEYYLMLASSMTGLVLMVSCVELITLVIALELSAFPLCIMIPMRREGLGRRVQMEAAVKFIMYGVAASGLMFFGLSYLLALTGSLHLDQLAAKLPALIDTPIAVAGLALLFCGIFYKLAVFPFHAWSPDVYQGAANETAAVVATLPKVAIIAVYVRLCALFPPEQSALVLLVGVLAALSMLYGNLVALVQQDFKRLLGFSAIAHAGYALVGFVTSGSGGFAAALFYIIGYLVMVVACFAVVVAVSRAGENVRLDDFAGLHRRNPLLAATLGVGVLGLAGLPPFAGFMGKLALLQCALAQGHLALAILLVVNSALAIYYYLQVVREAYFRDPGDRPAVPVDLATRAVCLLSIIGTLWLGLFPGRVLAAIASALAASGLAP